MVGQIWKNWRWSTLLGLTAGLVISIMSVVAFTSYLRAQEAQDCDDNAVIRCGVTGLEHLKEKYRGNEQGNVQAIFGEFGITSESALNGMVEGRVGGDNKVYVGNQVVATNAYTAGRQNMTNETGSSTPIAGGAAYRRHPSVSFANPNGSLRALVKMEGNIFRYAVILSCGNPVSATPVQPSGGPQPQPTPQPQPQFTITKDVRIVGTSAWAQNVTARQGDRLEFRIIVSNTGQTDLQNVIVRDTAPAGTTLAENSLRIAGQTETRLDIFSQGTTIPSIPKGQQVEITFQQLTSSISQQCNARLRNVAYAKVGNGAEKQDDATATIACEQQQQPVATPAVTTTPPPSPPPVQTVGTTPTPTPVTTTIPVTGIGSIFGTFTAFTLAGTAFHRYLVGRRG